MFLGATQREHIPWRASRVTAFRISSALQDVIVRRKGQTKKVLTEKP